MKQIELAILIYQSRSFNVLFCLTKSTKPQKKQADIQILELEPMNFSH